MNNVRITGERQREKRSVQRKWETDRHSLKGGEQEEDGGRRTEDGGRREDGMWRAARRGCDGGSFPSLFLTHTRIWIPSGTQTLPVPPLNGCPGEGRKGNRLKMEAGHSCNRFSHFPPSGGILHLFTLPLPSLPPSFLCSSDKQAVCEAPLTEVQCSEGPSLPTAAVVWSLVSSLAVAASLHQWMELRARRAEAAEQPLFKVGKTWSNTVAAVYLRCFFNAQCGIILQWVGKNLTITCHDT